MFPPALMNAAFKEAEALYSELNNSNPAWKKIYSDYSAFRRDQNLWFRFTESTFRQLLMQRREACFHPAYPDRDALRPGRSQKSPAMRGF